MGYSTHPAFWGHARNLWALPPLERDQMTKIKRAFLQL